MRTTTAGWISLGLIALTLGLTAISLIDWSGGPLAPTGRISTPVGHPDEQPAENLSVAQQVGEADLRILMIGNSHTAPIPGHLQALFAGQQPERSVLVRRALGYGFLVDHAENKDTLNLIEQEPWDVVILQAQKYSTSGKYHYPYDGAIKLAILAQQQGSRVILFPEWSRRDMPDEYRRINRVHQEIAGIVGADVAPVGQAWDDWMEQADAGTPTLYAPDGNHASEHGSYLTACVLYCLLVKRPIAGKGRKSFHDAAWRAVEQD